MEKKQVSKKKVAVLMAAVWAVLAVVAVVVFLSTDAGKYMLAQNALSGGNYEKAQTMFEALEDYRDSKTLAKRAKEGAERSSAKVDEFISMGTYEQDGNLDNGPDTLKWRVLAIKDGKMLVVCRTVIETMPFHDTADSVTWEDSSMRAWLNGAFYDEAFSKAEKKSILLTTLENEDNKKYGTSDCGETQDRIFLLSAAEARKYCVPTTVLLAKPTQWAQRDLIPLLDTSGSGNCAWWLRSVGGDETHASIAYFDKSIDDYGVHTYFENIGVRPAMWIEIDT